MSLNLIIENCVTAGKEITKKLVQKRKSESCRERCMYAHGLSLVQSHRRAGWEALLAVAHSGSRLEAGQPQPQPLLRAASRRALSASEGGDCTASLPNLSQRSITLMV